ncbi:MAG: hypothetical protein QXP20_02120 [Candidatus Bathyarchaeia archaeon]
MQNKKGWSTDLQNRGINLVVILLVGIGIRFLLAPTGASRDVFVWLKTGWAVVNRFSTLYSFRWGYEYPPLWGFICGLVYAVYPAASMYDPVFLILMKSPLIVADVITFCFLCRLFRSFLKDNETVLWGMLFFLNPFVILLGAFYGFFDSLAVMFLVMMMYFLHRQNSLRAGLTAGLAMLTKQYTFPVVVLLTFLLGKRLDFQKALVFSGTAITAFLIGSAPFLFYDLWGYVKTIVYTTPTSLEASCTGLWSVLLGLTRHTPFEVLDWWPWLIEASYYVFYALMIAPALVIVFSRKLSFDVNRVCLLEVLIFLCFSPIVHSQYLLLFIPFTVTGIAAGELPRPWFILSLLPLIAFIPSALPTWLLFVVRSAGLFLALVALLLRVAVDFYRGEPSKLSSIS